MRLFRRRVRSTRFLMLCVAVGVLLCGTAVIAYASYPSSGVQVYTGCLTQQGVLNNVAINATAPLHSCGSNQTLVHLSGGTITSITAGTGLTGGGSDGSVGLSLASGYQLPQGCGADEFPVADGDNNWNCGADFDPGYTAGTGIVRTQNPEFKMPNFIFSLDPAFQLPQTGCSQGQVVASDGAGGWSCESQSTNFAASGQDCPAGQFVTGIDANGNIECSQPTVDELQNSPCNFNGDTGTLVLDTDSTTGAESMTCESLVSTTVQGALSLTRVIFDDGAGAGGQEPTFANVSGTTVSHIFHEGGDLTVELISGNAITGGGGQPFQFTCNGGPVQSASLSTSANQAGTFYEGICNVNPISGNVTVIAASTLTS